MAVRIYGVTRLVKELDSKFGKRRMNAIVSDALDKASLVMGMEIQRQLKTFKDTGATMNEMTIRPPRDDRKGQSAIIHWQGPKSRYRIIHLNEWGHFTRDGRFRKPAGFGKIAKALQNGKKQYSAVLRDEIRRSL